jgi:glutaredoxin
VDLNDMAAFEKFKAETGASEVPVLRVGPTTLKGFEPEGWNATLDGAGYPGRVSDAVRAALKPRPAAPSRGRYESAQPAGPVAIRLFTSPDCAAPCADARAFLGERKAAFQEVSVADPAAYAELESLSGSSTVPMLVVGTRVVKGFEPRAYAGALSAQPQAN